MFKDIDFRGWPAERAEKLKAIKRYSITDRMMYRSNLWTHTHRMMWMVETLADEALKFLTINIERARVLALVHDDAELITGDIQAGHKFLMSRGELEQVERDEAAAIEQLAVRYPEIIHSYSYRELLFSALYKKDTEAQLVMYVDKLDAFCESLHEVLAGNLLFLRPVLFYERTMTEFGVKYPKIRSLLQAKSTPLTDIERRESPMKILSERYRQFNQPHTEQSINIETDFAFYNAWRKIVVTRGGREGVRWLTEKQEGLRQI